MDATLKVYEDELKVWEAELAALRAEKASAATIKKVQRHIEWLYIKAAERAAK